MSMNWSVPFSAHARAGESWLRRLATAAERRWVAFCEWRLEQIAIAQLRGMSDRELQDIGLIRSEIGMAVRLHPLTGTTDDRGQPRTKWRGFVRGA